MRRCTPLATTLVCCLLGPASELWLADPGRCRLLIAGAGWLTIN